MDTSKSKFAIITRARKILDLPESATLDQIKKNFTQLIKKWHPDKNLSETELAESKTREIIHAYKVIKQYCEEYHFSFRRQEVDKYLSDRERWIKQFGNDAVWPG
jgi:DnaJ-class molecular chaperone